MVNEDLKIIAIIPVRKGSQRVKNKNIKPFGDTNLLELKIGVLKKIDNIEKIIVNTDSYEMAEIAKNNDCEVIIRDEFYASSKINNTEYWEYLAKSLKEKCFILCQVTSPFVKTSTYKKAIKLFFEESYDSVNSVSVEKKFLWKDDSPINYKYELTPKSQDLDKIISLNFGITIVKTELLRIKKNLVLENRLFIELDKIESLDIDDEFDFEIAEYLYNKYGKGLIYD
jgi:CMP-N,N'-diacetyllegionaminic acid synthase